MDQKTLGVIGGLGPLATIYFCEKVIKITDADTDQDHIKMIINNDGSIPDRTSYILDQSNENPIPKLVENARNLEESGVDVLVIPCNTAHYFYEEIKDQVSIPIINMVLETVKYVKSKEIKKIGILATRGTISTNLYQSNFLKYGIEPIVPNTTSQDKIMDIIYRDIKGGREVNMEHFNEVVQELKQQGCQAIILGCTELSILKKDQRLNDFFIDSLEVLAERSVEFCGKSIRK